MRPWRVASGAVALAFIAAGYLVLASPVFGQGALTYTFSPSAGPVGTVVHFSGSGCPPNPAPPSPGADLTFSVLTGSGRAQAYQSNADGTFSGEYAVVAPRAGEESSDSRYPTFVFCTSTQQDASLGDFTITSGDSVSIATTTTTRAPAAGCHPAYAGVCLPADTSQDVDCPGGTGNGPLFAPATDFRVVGDDVYGLDADSDGIACESDSGEVAPAASPTAGAPAAVQCHPSYPDVCLPADTSQDVDCAGGSGDGPIFVSEVNFRVLGDDVYGLDADRDGIGCEGPPAGVTATQLARTGEPGLTDRVIPLALGLLCVGAALVLADPRRARRRLG